MRNSPANRSSRAASTRRKPRGTQRKTSPSSTRSSASARSSASVRSAASSRARRKRGIRIGRRRIRRRVLVIALLGLVGMGSCIVLPQMGWPGSSASYRISEQVYQYEPLVSAYAAEYGISDYLPVLLSIMQAESGGQGTDVMQSSESLGLPVNTLETEASIEQGVKFFSELVQEADERNLDLPSVIQAYNYGRGFLKYVQEHGGAYTFETASEFGRLHSGQQKIEYNNPMAVQANGGWRWAYGNMFYYPIVQKYLDNNGFS